MSLLYETAGEMVETGGALAAVSSVTPPPFTPPTRAQIAAAGYVFPETYGADPTGVNDSTVAVQDAVNYAFNNAMVVYFAPGATYLVSNPIYCIAFINSSAGSPFTQFCLYGGYNVANPTKTGRATIKLASGAANFQNAANPWPVLVFRTVSATGTYETGNIPTGYYDPYGNGWCTGFGDTNEPWAEDIGAMFSFQCYNLNINTSGNPGAIGAHIGGCQGCMVGNMMVTGTGSFACFAGLPCAGGIAVNLEGDGGQYGMFLSNNWLRNGTECTGGMPVVTGLRLYGQTVMSIFGQNDICPLMISGFDIQPASGAIVSMPLPASGSTVSLTYNWLDTYYTCNGICMVDGMITQPTGLVFNNQQGNDLYLRNVYISGTTTLIQSGGNAVQMGAGAWTLINEYSANCQRGSTATSADYGFNGNPIAYLQNALINGTINNALETVVSITQNSAAPPANIVTQHYVDPFPQYDNGPCANILNYGGAPYTGGGPDAPNTGNPVDHWTYFNNVHGGDYTGVTDNRAAFNAAMAAAQAAGHNRVFLPIGLYPVSSPGVSMLSNTVLFGIGQRSSQIYPYYTWVPSSQAFVVTSANSASGTAQLANMCICNPQTWGSFTSPDGPNSGNWFGDVNWQTGAASSIFNVLMMVEYDLSGIEAIGNPHTAYLAYTNNGGGSLFGFISAGVIDDECFGYVSLSINGTSQPLWIYSLNSEGNDNEQSGYAMQNNYSITNASNVRIYGHKQEGRAPACVITNSNNIGIYAAFGGITGAIDNAGGSEPGGTVPTSFYTIDSPSNNLLIAHALPCRFEITGLETLLDEGTGASVPYPNGCTLYKKGTINDAVMVA